MYDRELGYYGNVIDDSVPDEPEENDYCDIEETTQTKKVLVTLTIEMDVEVDGWINRDGEFDSDTLEEDIESAVKDKFSKYAPEIADWEVIKD